MIVDTPPIATVMSHYDETGQPVACGSGRIPAGARTIATHPSLRIPCGALVILTLPDGHKYAFRRADSGPYITGRLVDARIERAARADEAVDVVTRVCREADSWFVADGGSTRHWARDHFLPALRAEGYVIALAAADQEDTDA